MNTYQIQGYHRQVGSIGVSETFKIKIDAISSRLAYLQARNPLQHVGYESILVIAIKMKCENCGKFHLVVPPDFYL